MKKLIIASVLGMSAVTAHAAESGAYVFGNLGYNTDKIKDSEGVKEGKAAGGGWEVGAGYRFGSYFATELSYIDLGKMQATVGDEDGDTTKASVKLQAERLAFVGILPVSDAVEVFGKVSLNTLHANVNGEKGSKVKPGLGIGASYAITKSLALRGEYEHIANMFKDDGGNRLTSGTNLFKVGVSYKF
ncbi:porin family protein [Chromobacterium sp. CV08]|uniref:porin family protein n=1 Tax=Chromobacterium sp. CV08 TaxID=3133274 RepID=UPI003DA99F79